MGNDGNLVPKSQFFYFIFCLAVSSPKADACRRRLQIHIYLFICILLIKICRGAVLMLSREDGSAVLISEVTVDKQRFENNYNTTCRLNAFVYLIFMYHVL